MLTSTYQIFYRLGLFFHLFVLVLEWDDANWDGGRLARDVSPVCFLNCFKEKKTSSAYTAILEDSSHMQSFSSFCVA
jgi:hypothetical protein